MKEIKGGITAPNGFLSAGLACGLKKSGNKDLALIFSKTKADAAGVFTQNDVKAAPVKLSQSRIGNGKARAIIANSGNANACTGARGMTDAEKMIELTAAGLEVKPEEVLIASTGIIGEPLDMDKIESGISDITSSLTDDGTEAAEAILTTDDKVKEIAYSFTLPQRGTTVKIGGIAKGSGMIHPNMATMLGFITTDINIKQELLQEALQEVVEVSFNRISVDGDQSTNDTVFVLANGEAGNNIIEEKDEDFQALVKALEAVAIHLAQAIVKDGEGATKFITIKVREAVSERQAVKIARTIANSSLVKTACFGNDPNWGRILAAIGNSKADIDPDQLLVAINGQQLFKDGLPVGKTRDDLEGLMDDEEIEIEVNLKAGKSSTEFWTTDLSYEYVEINAEYHT